MGEIIALTRMTGGEYDAARAAIGNRKDAKPKWDQELCKLLTASGWTTDALARKEGIHHRTMQQRLLFGRFVAFADTRAVACGSSFLQGLTERRFRTYWRETVKSDNERNTRSRMKAMWCCFTGNSTNASPGVVLAILPGPTKE